MAVRVCMCVAGHSGPWILVSMTLASSMAALSALFMTTLSSGREAAGSGTTNSQCRNGVRGRSGAAQEVPSADGTEVTLYGECGARLCAVRPAVL